MGAALLAAGLGGAVLSAAGTYAQGQANSQNAAYQAQVAANNAVIARTNAQLEMQSGETQAGNQGLKTRAAVGTTTAGQGASGVDVNKGSSVDVRAGEAEIGALDALTIRSNSARRAYGYQVASTSDTAESGLLTTESAQASAMAPLAASGSLLSNASSAGGRYAQYLTTAPS